MKITLVRHGETEENYNGKIQGRSNYYLNDTGRRQAIKVKNKIRDNDYTVCYMSSLARAVETAIILIGDRVKTIVDDRLIERDMGNLEGKDYSLYNHDLYWDYELNSNQDSVEAIQDIYKRCEEFLSMLKKDYKKTDSILVVTHGAVYRVLRHLLLNHKKEGNLYDTSISNCQIEEFIIK